MGTTVLVIVATPYLLSDDEGHPLVPNGEIFEVNTSERIQAYIDLGQLILVPTPDVPVSDSLDVLTEEVPAKKTRMSAQKQENSDG